MKNLLLLAAFCVTAAPALAGERNPYGYTSPYTYQAPKPSTPSYGTGSNYDSNYVAPHVRNNGSYVEGHYRSNPNETKLDNWSTKGNTNPYTGQSGTRNPYRY
jgi:hypothetical protein